MRTGLDELRATLRAHAEGYADADAMLAGVGPAYRRRRRRRVAGLTVGAGALAAMLVPALLAGGGAGLPAPPVPPGATIAITAPGTGIGADARYFHFAVGDFAHPARAEWRTGEDLEELLLTGVAGADESGFQVTLKLQPHGKQRPPDPTQDASEHLDQERTVPATVGGRPAEVATGLASRMSMIRVTWQPGDGVDAALVATGSVTAEQLLAFAGTVDLARGHECRPRLTATALPAGARLTGCSVVPETGSGSLTIRGAGGTLQVAIPIDAVFGIGHSPGATVARLPSGRHYEVLPNPYYTALIRTPDPYAEIGATGTYGLAEAELVADGLQPS